MDEGKRPLERVLKRSHSVEDPEKALRAFCEDAQFSATPLSFPFFQPGNSAKETWTALTHSSNRIDEYDLSKLFVYGVAFVRGMLVLLVSFLGFHFLNNKEASDVALNKVYSLMTDLFVHKHRTRTSSDSPSPPHTPLTRDDMPKYLLEMLVHLIAHFEVIGDNYGVRMVVLYALDRLRSLRAEVEQKTISESVLFKYV